MLIALRGYISVILACRWAAVGPQDGGFSCRYVVPLYRSGVNKAYPRLAVKCDATILMLVLVSLLFVHDWEPAVVTARGSRRFDTVVLWKRIITSVTQPPGHFWFASRYGISWCWTIKDPSFYFLKTLPMPQSVIATHNTHFLFGLCRYGNV